MWNDFVVTLGNPVVEKDLKAEYLHNHLKDDNGKVYQKVVEETLNNRKLIPILEPFLDEYYQNKFFPIFSLYRKARKGKFGEMIERILLKHGNEGKVC
ncbi:hypothetical protein DTX80_00855 [Bacilli bacterium]|nr:hypothetical protein WH51_06485 [Bacilli bacterium VT-13-104]PZD89565.1 hypothetical protein DEJ64_00530 [Bacilli bacterium]PZD91087.1 hypothetical protein DEJ60_00530 [Bacilli bacterium]PZD92634.1 hypothetical protein DEJ66_00530 [Bacilli bacterium]RCO07525.1 hypothetical protein DTX80_00855 [Bacilli bacterium]